MVRAKLGKSIKGLYHAGRRAEGEGRGRGGRGTGERGGFHWFLLLFSLAEAHIQTLIFSLPLDFMCPIFV